MNEHFAPGPHQSRTDRPLDERDRSRRLLSTARILVVDDDSEEVGLLKAMLRNAGFAYVSGLTDARQFEWRFHAAPPDLLILDLQMPDRDGFAILELLRPWIGADQLPVLVMTEDPSVEVRRQALALGARDFVNKPLHSNDVTLRVRNMLETRLLYLDLRKQNWDLIDAVFGRTRELEHSHIEMLERLAIAAEYRDDSTGQHTRRVGEIAARLAVLLGLPDAEVRLIRRAAPLHDVGKVGIPDALLLKPAGLTPDERRIMQSHTVIGAHILSGSDAPLLRMAESIALSHHERWDGDGYPSRIAGEAIPPAARIVAVADAFDALTNDRPYRPARSLTESLAEIRRHRGRQFDPRIIDVLDERVVSPMKHTA
jgi:putative two-component system response regulator